MKRFIGHALVGVGLALTGLSAGAPALAQSAPPVNGGRAAIEPRIPARNAADALVRALDQIATRERYGPTSLFNMPPLNPATVGLNWLPDMRVSIPPRAMIVAPEPATPVSAALIPVETANTQVASARGNDGMFMGLQFTLPWLLP